MSESKTTRRSFLKSSTVAATGVSLGLQTIHAPAVQAALVEQYEKERLVGHISRDSTAIVGREKPASPRKAEAPQPPKRRRGRPRKGEERAPSEPSRLERQRSQTLEEMRKELPKDCDRGTKKNSRGYRESWNGYKLHIDGCGVRCATESGGDSFAGTSADHRCESAPGREAGDGSGYAGAL